MNIKQIDLTQEFSGDVWAREFLRINPEEKTGLDLDIMRAWFCNAIMAGYDHANRNRPTYSKEELLEMMPGEVKRLNRMPYLGYNDMVSGYNQARQEIATALAGKLEKPEAFMTEEK